MWGFIKNKIIIYPMERNFEDENDDFSGSDTQTKKDEDMMDEDHESLDELADEEEDEEEDSYDDVDLV